MAQIPKHRQAIVDTAIRLFRQQGYAASGLNQIVEESGAPKGSLYHYFPEGKLAIAAEAVRSAGQRVQKTLDEMSMQTEGAGDLLRNYAQRLGGWMAESGFRDGGPITTTLLETTPQTESIRLAGAQAFDGWASTFATRLRQQGVDEARARRLAMTAVAALEGALLLARVYVSEQPLIEMADEMARAFDAAIDEARRQR